MRAGVDPKSEFNKRKLAKGRPRDFILGKIF